MSDWEKEFDVKFLSDELAEYYGIHVCAKPNDVKNFIRELILRERREAVREYDEQICGKLMAKAANEWRKPMPTISETHLVRRIK